METTTTVAGEFDRMVSLYRSSYMVRAERRSDGSLRFPSRTLDGQRVLSYVIETTPVSLGGGASGSGGTEDSNGGSGGTKGETKGGDSTEVTKG